MSDNEDLELNAAMFEEPEDFLPEKPKSHHAVHIRKIANADPPEIRLLLVGLSPLWGHLLWNAGKYTADYLDEHRKDLVEGKRILELGAAAALPSLVCAINNASLVVCTDYPDPDLISNIEQNFTGIASQSAKYSVQGYIWGNDVSPLFCRSLEGEVSESEKFDLVILSDLVFNHTEHAKLLETCRLTVKRTGKCLVVFSPHRPALLNEDLNFFTKCEEYGFKAERIDLIQMKPMFEEDDATADIRARVYSYFLIPFSA